MLMYTKNIIISLAMKKKKKMFFFLFVVYPFYTHYIKYSID